MSWSLTVPKQENTEEFVDALWRATETPKADRRTKIGKTRANHVYNAQEALELLAEATGATAGTASGHTAPDMSGYISVNVTVPAP